MYTTVKVKCGRRVAGDSVRDAIMEAIYHEETCIKCQRKIKLNKKK